MRGIVVTSYELRALARQPMATLRWGGEACKDSAGNELKIGGLVADEMFGEGCVRGVIACDVGGGCNVLIG